MSFDEYKKNKIRSQDEKYMELAIKAAENSKSQGELARGAVLAFPNDYFVGEQRILSEHNQLSYAEMNAIKSAQKSHKNMKDGVLYTTTEPSPLCFCAAHECGIREFVFGCWDKVNGFVSSAKITQDKYDASYKPEVLSEQCYKVCNVTLRENLEINK